MYICEYVIFTMSDKNENHAASTSNADKLIRAAEELKPSSQTPSYECTKCGNTAYTCTRPLGGYLLKTCTKCGNTSFRGRPTIAPLLPENLYHGQGTARGPTKKPTGHNATTEKFTHKFRNKGKGYKHD